MFKKTILSIVAIATISTMASANDTNFSQKYSSYEDYFSNEELSKFPELQKILKETSETKSNKQGIIVETNFAFYNNETAPTLTVGLPIYSDYKNLIAYGSVFTIDTNSNYDISLMSMTGLVINQNMFFPYASITQSKTELKKGKATETFSDTYLGLGVLKANNKSSYFVEVAGGKESLKTTAGIGYALFEKVSLNVSLSKTFIYNTEGLEDQMKTKVGFSYLF